MMVPGSPASLPPVLFEQFAGPLDLLLEEVRRQKIALEKIAVAPIVGRYLEYMRAAADRNLDLDIEWLHMAATLIHWKSKTLLPSDAGSCEKDLIRDELIQQLITHRRQAVDELANRRSAEEAHYSRTAGGEFRVKPEDDPEDPLFLTVWDLMQQARELAHWAEQYHADRSQWRESFCVELDVVTIAEMIEYLRSRLASEAVRLDVANLIQKQATPSRRSCLFLGMLEMVRDQQLQIEQNEPLGPIWAVPGSGLSGA